MSELLERALDAIRGRREAARVNGIELIGVFGSVARGEARPESDVDIAYDIVGRASLLDLGGLLMDLRQGLGREVGLTDISQLRPSGQALVMRDLVPA